MSYLVICPCGGVLGASYYRKLCRQHLYFVSGGALSAKLWHCSSQIPNIQPPIPPILCECPYISCYQNEPHKNIEKSCKWHWNPTSHIWDIGPRRFLQVTHVNIKLQLWTVLAHPRIFSKCQYSFFMMCGYTTNTKQLHSQLYTHAQPQILSNISFDLHHSNKINVRHLNCGANSWLPLVQMLVTSGSWCPASMTHWFW